MQGANNHYQDLNQSYQHVDNFGLNKLKTQYEVQSTRAGGGRRGFDFGIFGGEEFMDEEEVYKQEDQAPQVMNVDEDFDYPQRIPNRDDQSYGGGSFFSH